MKKTILLNFAVLLLLQLPAQNLITNPDAESLPRGTGWTIVSQGSLTCLLAPTDNILNWTMKPDGSTNYPYDHTTGSSGGTVFFSGCASYFQGPFELYQTVDVATDAPLIDLGNQLYTFSGYMQTPVSNQTDQGRFIVDFLDASSSVLGTSYTTSWQSFYGGSGTPWTLYNNTRIAPAGTRKIKIRLQTQMLINQPAINVYFDDISLTKPNLLPVSLISFTAKELQDKIYLNWTTSNELQVKQFELEHSNDGTYFNHIDIIPAGKTSYQFIDNNSYADGENFYRLKMIEADGKIAYSNIVLVKSQRRVYVSLFPNPANNTVKVTGGFQHGKVLVINSSGKIVLAANTNTSSVTLDISQLPPGLYVVRLSDQITSINKKLVIRPK